MALYSLAADAPEPCIERHFSGHRGPITQVRFSPSGRHVATSSLDASVIVWDLQRAAHCLRFNAHSDKVYSIAWSPHGNLLASASKDCTVKVWEPKASGVVGDFYKHNAIVRVVDIDVTGTTLVTGADDRIVKLWQIANKRLLLSMPGFGQVRAAKFSPNGNMLMVSGGDRNIRIMDVRTGQRVRTITEVDGCPLQVAWHPNNDMFAVALNSNQIKIYEASSGNLVQLYEVHRSQVNDIAFDSTGSILLSASDDFSIKMLDLLGGRPVFTLRAHANGVLGVAFSKDSQRFASAGKDCQLMVWKSNIDNFEAHRMVVDENAKNAGEESVDNFDASQQSNDRSILLDARDTEAYMREKQCADYQLIEANVDWTSHESSGDSCRVISSCSGGTDLNKLEKQIDEVQDKFAEVFRKLKRFDKRLEHLEKREDN